MGLVRFQPCPIHLDEFWRILHGFSLCYGRALYGLLLRLDAVDDFGFGFRLRLVLGALRLLGL